MKNITLLVSLFVILFASVAADVVLDTEGDVLKNGGGLGLAATGNETCPLTVVQIPSETTDGLALIISSPARIAYIAEGLLLDIAFSAVPTCAPTPSKWTIIEEDPAGMSVKISGYSNTVDGKFKIIKYQGLFYKLKFCSSDGDPCQDLGLYYDETGNRHLVIVTDETPLAVVFKKIL